MTRSFRSKALERFAASGNARSLSVQKPERIARLLKALAAATKPSVLDLPGLRFHSLKGREKGRYAVWVSENWRLTFGWDGIDAIEIDLEDYH
ncbi:MAG TPA: type II toxin-antitoxin system RelE/ParE family toxin [Rhizomicrobium sp.]|jgi:proteic killer suppression protein|nr:type II toxin-antitoxin system RelE/ParE family toxin [Rhizomicrobium sp.]